VLVGAVTGYGGRAYAACILTTPFSTFTCSAANNTQQTITTNNANVSTVAGFSVVTGDARALSITAAGDLTYTNANASTLTAATTLVASTTISQPELPEPTTTTRLSASCLTLR
jgi:hypothetical protein